jgi:hypothetical protein
VGAKLAREAALQPIWFQVKRVSPVGAGLLAKATLQSMEMLDVLASSRASPLPQVFAVHMNLCLLKIQCGSELARDSGTSVTQIWIGYRHREQARSHRINAVRSRTRSAIRPPRGGR